MVSFRDAFSRHGGWLNTLLMYCLHFRSGVECIHCSGRANTVPADITNYHPTQVKFLSVGSIIRAVQLLAHFMDSDDVSPDEKHDLSLGIELRDEVGYRPQVRVVRCSIGRRDLRSAVRDVITFQEAW